MIKQTQSEGVACPGSLGVALLSTHWLPGRILGVLLTPLSLYPPPCEPAPFLLSLTVTFLRSLAWLPFRSPLLLPLFLPKPLHPMCEFQPQSLCCDPSKNHILIFPLPLLNASIASWCSGRKPIPHSARSLSCSSLFHTHTHCTPATRSHAWVCLKQAWVCLPLGLCTCSSFCLDCSASAYSSHPSFLPLGDSPLRGLLRPSLCPQKPSFPVSRPAAQFLVCFPLSTT